MKINYQETTSDLATRIDIHNQYGARNIDEWMLDVLKPSKGIKILDVGCGAGKQCFSFYDYLDGQAEIIGGDVNEELLNFARAENQKRGLPIQFVFLDYNQPFPYPDNRFDLVSCCFAIYYAEDVPFTLREMHRVLKPGGCLFTTGPMPNNKQLFYDIIREATNGRLIPPMPGSSRYSSQFLSVMKELFTQVDVHIFENPLRFESVEPFIAYTRASLSEDRKLWSSFFKDKDEFEQIMQAIRQVAESHLEQEGNLVMTKVVGGFVATK